MKNCPCLAILRNHKGKWIGFTILTSFCRLLWILCPANISNMGSVNIKSTTGQTWCITYLGSKEAVLPGQNIFNQMKKCPPGTIGWMHWNRWENQQLKYISSAWNTMQCNAHSQLSLLGRWKLSFAGYFHIPEQSCPNNRDKVRKVKSST